MAAHDSQYPEEPKPKTIRVDSTGISMNWRNVIIALLTVILGGGGYTGIQFVTKAELDERLVETKNELSDKIDEIKIPVEKNTDAIGGITATIGKVAKIQNQDIAIREARRVVYDNIKCRPNDSHCRDRQVFELERLRRINEKRLESNGDICSSLECR